MYQQEKFADFVLSIKFPTLPRDVLDYSKIVFLDTLICGLAASRLERSRINQRVAKRLGGPNESTVFGLHPLVASSNAAYANAEMMNALDADETFYNAAHFSAISAAVALAEGERLDAPGADLLCGYVAGFEVSARLNLASKLIVYKGDQFQWSSLVGTGADSFAAAMAAGYLAKLSREQLVHAMGLVGWTATAPKSANMPTRSAFNSFKYAPYGIVAQTGLMASILAQEGYIGDRDVLDITPGFFEAQGYFGAYRELLDCKDDKWWILETSLKPYPSCRFTHAAIDAVLHFQREFDLPLEAISKIEIKLNPIAYSMYFFHSPASSIPPDHRAPLHGAFNIPYITALALLGFRRGPGWYSPENLSDAAVWDLASRITTSQDEELSVEWRDAVLNTPVHRPRFNRAIVSITSNDGRCQSYASDYNQGDPWSDDTRADWKWLKSKMNDFMDGIMPVRQQDELFDIFRNLESVSSVRREISPLLTIGTGDS